MDVQTLSKKSRKELNGSLMKLYRHLTFQTDSVPDKEDQENLPVVHEDEEPEEDQENELEITTVIGIGI